MSDDRKRYQVFVSSTYTDLRQERQHVTAALLECDAFPAGMELFPAADDDAWTLIRRVIDESDYYLLIIGGRYGTVDEIQELSYTEMEYDYAVSRRKPVMAFLHGSPETLQVKNAETSDKGREKLAAFRTRVEKQKHVKYWITAEQLAGQVALTFNRFVRSYPAIGWIRADQLAQPETLKQLAQAQAQIETLMQRVQATETGPPPGTEDLAQGQDELELPVLVRFSYKSGGLRKHDSEWVLGLTTWDDVFAAVCPRLLDECEEEALREALEAWGSVEFYSEMRRALRESVVKANGEPTSITNRSCHIDDEDLGTIILQLVALGFIAKSERRRSVSDTGTYWSLTPYGSAKAIQLRAKRRQSGPSLEGSASQDNKDGDDDQADEPLGTSSPAS